jgi:aryl-alcohol dehydrogenase-like predicted oxidoreductase
MQPGAGLQTFYAYGNQRHIAGQVAAYGRQNVFVSTGIPCGCCGADSPRIEPMNASLALGYVMEDLAQLNTSHIDLLLFHHRCRTPDETASVWKGFEAAKNRGLARHIGARPIEPQHAWSILLMLSMPGLLVHSSEAHHLRSTITVWQACPTSTHTTSRYSSKRPLSPSTCSRLTLASD